MAIKDKKRRNNSDSGTSSSESDEDTTTMTEQDHSDSSSEEGNSDPEWDPAEDIEETDGGEDDDDVDEDDIDDLDLDLDTPPPIMIFTMPQGMAFPPTTLPLRIKLPNPPPIVQRRGERRGRSRTPSQGKGALESGSESERPRTKRVASAATMYMKNLSPDERSYFRALARPEQDKIIRSDEDVKNLDSSSSVPMRFKVLGSDMDRGTKALVLAKVDQFQRMNEGTGEYFKLRNWLQAVCRIPFGKHLPLPVTPNDPIPKVAGFLQDIRGTLDKTVYGHSEAKNQMMRILAQWIRNPDAKGHCIGIHGPPGSGKTSLVKNGICKALGLPFGFLALGGASDGAFLEGHGFTYEGSTWGKIAEILMKTQCMNPIFFMDELDKVSGTRRGEEISNILIHLTDSSQNDRFQDRYFGEIEFDLSKALIIFSYNDESLVNPILKDRMVTIRVKGYDTKEKLSIATDYLVPEVFSQYKVTNKDILFSKDILEDIIRRVPEEEGVRNLKRGIEHIVSWINMCRYIPDKDTNQLIEFPVTVTSEMVKKYVPRTDTGVLREDVARSMYI